MELNIGYVAPSQGLNAFLSAASDNHLRASSAFVILVRKNNKSTQGKGQPDCRENKRQHGGGGVKDGEIERQSV